MAAARDAAAAAETAAAALRSENEALRAEAQQQRALRVQAERAVRRWYQARWCTLSCALATQQPHASTPIHRPMSCGAASQV